MNTIAKLLIPLFLVIGCDSEDSDDAELNDEVVESKTEGKGHRGRGGLKQLDTDGDGAISLAEAKDHRIAAKFSELDADKDGKLSKDELQAMKGRHGKGGPRMDPAGRAAHFMAKFDADKDGALSTTELAAHPKFAEKFATLDSDRNGKLTTTELQAMKRPERGDKGGRGRWHDMDPAERTAHFMTKFDADKDGTLSTAELAARPMFAEKFAEVDTDKNGKLSTAELTAFKPEPRGKRGSPRDEKRRG